jgi:hypothetical protein
MKKCVHLLLVAAVTAAAAGAAEWSEPVHVLHEFKPCVTYRAKIDGGHLIVEAALQPGWHTFAIDNEERAAKKRAGQPSLGIDQPTQIDLPDGLERTGSWYQTPPKDFSKPQLRWYSFGFEDRALFVSKVRSTKRTPANVQIRGQACTDKTCKNIDITLTVPPAAQSSPAAATHGVALDGLVEVLPTE